VRDAGKITSVSGAENRLPKKTRMPRVRPRLLVQCLSRELVGDRRERGGQRGEPKGVLRRLVTDCASSSQPARLLEFMLAAIRAFTVVSHFCEGLVPGYPRITKSMDAQVPYKK
jgi:hypothetical protein